MSARQDKLCAACIAAFRGDSRIHDPQEWFRAKNVWTNYFDVAHHRTYRDFASSTDMGCFLCSWLWAKHTPLPTPVDPAGRPALTTGDFRILCRVESDYKNECNMVFYVVCPWAADFELCVRLLRDGDSYQRLPEAPRLPWSGLQACPWLKLDPDIGSTQSIGTIQTWISKCGADHGYCCPNPSATNTFFPTRIIDVEDIELGIVRLRDRGEVLSDAQAKATTQNQGALPGFPVYWTLSHRWGDQKSILLLLKDTEHSFHRGIPLGTLSPTFRDSALLVHRLGYRYIWIDSLCIFQDSLADWQQEAAKMVDVYRNSFCNISAAAASFNPSTMGLFHKRKVDARLLYPRATNVEIRDRYGNVTAGPWVAWNDSRWADEVESVPISTRGWVVQERFLATRVIHFTQSAIYWECLESLHCEAELAGDALFTSGRLSSGSQTTIYKSARLELARSHSKPQGSMSTLQHYEAWGDVVSMYASSQLTKESDRFVAMSGIAKAFREVNDDTYLAGLWKRTLHSDLQWRTKAGQGVTASLSTSYAPSWSWVSMVGGEVELHVPRGKFANLPTPLFKLVDTRIATEPLNGDDTAMLCSAELDIECMLYYYRWDGHLETLAVYTDEAKTQCYFEKRKEEAARSLRLDTSDTVRRFAKAAVIEGVCVPVCGAYGGYGGGTNEYLVLEHDAHNKYRRIGLLTAGEIGQWISEWSGQGDRITLI